MSDPYPTRLDHAIAPIPRQEPAVWGTESDGPLVQQQLDWFAAQGYLVRPGTVSEDRLPALRHEIDRIAADLDAGDPRVNHRAE